MPGSGFTVRRGVRARITAAATVVAGLAVLAAGLWLVRAVEGSLNDDLRSTEAADIARVTRALGDGTDPADLDFGTLVSTDAAAGQTVQVVRQGKVVASSPNAVGMPALDAVLVSGVSQSGPVAGVSAAAPARRVLDGPDGSAYSVSSAAVDAGGGAMFTVIAASPLDPVRKSVDAVEDGLLVALPVLVLAVGLITWVLTGRALRPVESIRSEVEAITGSTLSRRVPVPESGDEVARLAVTMNAMLDRLESASVRQQQFVADASHELRSPVAAIRTELEVARRTAGPDDWDDVIDQVLHEESRLEATITDLLVLASLDEGAAAPDDGAVDLVVVATDEIERVRRSGQPIALSLDGVAHALVHGSKVQLGRAIGNLVDNAARHASTAVVVMIAVADGRVRVTVDDDGSGIPDADRERVFERFTRLDSHRARTATSGGAGLGLSLVRRIAERHGGSASAEAAPTGGARLVLILPVL